MDSPERWGRYLAGMTMAKSTLTILGVHLESEAYPNVLHRVRALEASKRFSVTKIHRTGWSAETQSSSGKRRLLRNSWRMFIAHCLVLFSYFRTAPTDCVYVPYPAIILLWVLSFRPFKQRSGRLVIDAFISLYDTIVLDRRLLQPRGWPARFLFLLERRALHHADVIIVDTPLTATHFATLYDLPRDQLVALPLATDEEAFRPSQYVPTRDVCHVLFVGTFIPLHGVQTIVEAIAKLRQHRGIHVRVIGDGQDANLVEDAISRFGHTFDWQRRWHDSEELAAEIAASDICLGIFGSTEKTQRVLPFKLYAYSRIGRCIITAKTECTASMLSDVDYLPWQHVPTANGEALASAIIELTENPDKRVTFANDAQRFYREKLSNEASQRKLETTLLS